MNPAEAAPLRSASSTRSFTAALIAFLPIAILFLGLRLAFSPQLDGLDDAGYLEAAQRVSRGESLDKLFPLFRTRVGMAYPLGWLGGAGWVEPSQFWFLTLAADFVALAALFAAGWILGGAAVGVCAAVLYATYPLAVQQAMMYFPTAFQVASIAIASALILWGERVVGVKRLWLGLAAGLFLGLGYLVKEDVAIVVAAIFAAALVVRFPRPSSAMAVCAGAALVFAAECFAYWQMTGSPLSRLSSTSGLGFVSQDHLRVGSIYHWDAYVRSLWLVPVQVGVVWWLALPALWVAFRSRLRGTADGPALAFFATLFLLVVAYLQFGTGSFSSYSPLPKSPRYTALVTPFLMLLVGAWIARWFEARRAIGVPIIAITVALAIPCMTFLAISSSERSRNTLAVLPVLDQLGGSPLYTDYYGVRLLRLLKSPLPDTRVWYHARFEENQMDVRARPAEESGVFVLLDRQMSKIYTSSYEMALPPSIDVPPPTWTVVWRHRAYSEGSFTRTLLERARSWSALLPNDFPLRERIRRSVTELIDGDDATLYRVP